MSFLLGLHVSCVSVFSALSFSVGPSPESLKAFHRGPSQTPLPCVLTLHPVLYCTLLQSHTIPPHLGSWVASVKVCTRKKSPQAKYPLLMGTVTLPLKPVRKRRPSTETVMLIAHRISDRHIIIFIFRYFTHPLLMHAIFNVDINFVPFEFNSVLDSPSSAAVQWYQDGQDGDIPGG